MEKRTVSRAVVKRLPRYYRYLLNLQHMGVSKVSSKLLAEMLGITASQVRQDFNCFGGFGHQGYGYSIATLVDELSQILGLKSQYNMIIIGAGNMGRALANYQGFKADGFNVIAVFDIKTDRKKLEVPLYHMDDLKTFIGDNQVDIAVITTQRSSAAQVAKQLTDLGIKSIWNFATVELDVPEDVIVENMSMSESLFVLSYRMTNRDAKCIEE